MIRLSLMSPYRTHYGMLREICQFGFTPPTKVTFFISVLVATEAIIIHYAQTIQFRTGLILLVAFFVLLAGNLFRGV